MSLPLYGAARVKGDEIPRWLLETSCQACFPGAHENDLAAHARSNASPQKMGLVCLSAVTERSD